MIAGRALQCMIVLWKMKICNNIYVDVSRLCWNHKTTVSLRWLCLFDLML